MTAKLVVLGSGGMAREIFFHALDCGYSDLFCIDPFSKEETLTFRGKNLAISRQWNVPKDFKYFVIGVGSPVHKGEFESLACAAGLEPCAPIVHPSATVQDAKLGPGTLVSPGARLTTNIKIGRHVIIGLNVTIGHDSTVGNFSSILNGCHISGRICVGDSTLVGAGAVIKEGLSIPSNTTIGAQAAVVKSIVENGVYAGVPAKKIKD